MSEQPKFDQQDLFTQNGEILSQDVFNQQPISIQPEVHIVSSAERDGFDPNARRVGQLKDVGGGLACAVNGELPSQTAVTEEIKSHAAVIARERNNLYEVPGRSKGRLNPADQPLSNSAIERIRAAQKPVDVKQALTAIAKARMILNNSGNSPRNKV